MKKLASILLVLVAFLIYFKDGNIIRAKEISVGQWSGLIKVITPDAVGLHDEVTYYRMESIEKIEVVK